MLFDYRVIENTCRPWIGKKMQEYMGAEEPTMIELVCNLLQKKSTHTELLATLEEILDEETGEFV